jgi:cell surface protein
MEEKMKFLRRASLLRLCVAIGMMMVGIAGCQPKITPTAVYYTVTLQVTGAEGGTLTAKTDGKTLTNNEKVKVGTKVRFIANPKSAEGYTVGAWTGTDAAVGTGAVELIITQDVNVTVAFVKITRYGVITFGASEGGSISAKVEGDTDNLQSDGKAPYGSIVTFTAIPEDGYVFDRWEGLTNAPSEETATYTVTGDRYVKAYFKSAALPYLSVASVVAGGGTVSFLGDDSRKTELKGKVIIPEWINGIHITGIELVRCTEITEVVLPESINFIKSFGGCTKLQTIKIPKNKKLTVINQSCFSGCAKLEKIYLPENITKIFEGAFSGCTSLELYLPKSIQSIGNYAFGFVYSGHTNDSRIKKVYIPSSISEIEKDRIKELIRRSNQNYGIGIQPEQIGEYDDTQPIP